MAHSPSTKQLIPMASSQPSHRCAGRLGAEGGQADPSNAGTSSVAQTTLPCPQAMQLVGAEYGSVLRAVDDDVEALCGGRGRSGVRQGVGVPVRSTVMETWIGPPVDCSVHVGATVPVKRIIPSGRTCFPGSGGDRYVPTANGIPSCEIPSSGSVQANAQSRPHAPSRKLS